MTSRWISRLALAALPLAGTVLAGCGTNDPTTASAYDGHGSDNPSGAPSGNSSGRSPLRALGEPIDVGGFRVRVAVEEVGGDKDSRWVLTTMRVKNIGADSRALPMLGMECSGSSTIGYSNNVTRSVAPGRSAKVEVPLFMTLPREVGEDGEDNYYDPIGPCEGTASISVTVSSGQPDYTMSESDGWRIDQATLDALNARLPFTRPGGEPKDPDRPYAWVDGDGAFSSGYQVVVVPGITADEAIRVLDPVRGSPSFDEYERVIVAENDDGVVLFTWWFVSDRYVRALSRLDGLAASYGNTVNGDDHVLVLRRGKVVRSFDPFLDHDYKKTRRLPEEKGLDLEYDTGPASWTLLERLTGIAITEDWLLDDRHPGFRLRD